MKVKIVLAGTLTFLVAAIVLLYKIDQDYLATLAGFQSARKDSANIQNANLQGVTNEGNRYQVHSKALDHIEAKKYRLSGITSKYYLDTDSKNFVDLLAKNGILDLDKNMIALNEEVQIAFDNGDKLLTDKLDVDFGKNFLTTNDKAIFKGAKIETTSEKGFSGDLKKKQIHCNGPIITLIY